MSNIRDTTVKRLRLVQDLEQQYGPTGVVPIVSTEHYDLIEHKPGVVCEATPAIAARMVFRHTHRIATPEEHKSYRDDLTRRTEELDKVEAERRMREGKFAVLTAPAAAPSAPSTLEIHLLQQLEDMRAEMKALRENAQQASPSSPKKVSSGSN
jgi:hypothetical protein